ncbi:MAG: DUF2062 domain-containing protein [Deltaproteobacteria bacterium]|nr:DUF2062 domain-containing protein [Deltaproteobacteria bacterium]
MRWLLLFIKARIDEHIVRPIKESASPVEEAALGTFVGIFVGLTPTVGIQMWIVFMIWVILKYILKIKFDLIIGTALVWISNPFTMFFMYYGFLLTGYAFFNIIGLGEHVVTYANFKLSLLQIVNDPTYGQLDIIYKSFEYLIIDLGFPMVLGSLFYATPFAFLSYIVVKKYLIKYRTAQARNMGITYEIWRERYEK